MLHDHYPNEFYHRLGADPGRLSNFWSQLAQTTLGAELIRNHSVLSSLSAHDLAHTIPIFLHDDAAPFTKKRSAYILQWGSAEPHAHGSEIDCCFPIATWEKVMPGTTKFGMRCTTRWLAWGVVFLVDLGLIQGGSPKGLGGIGCEGNILQQKHDSDTFWRAAWVQLRADLQWLADDLGIDHYNGPKVCGLCQTFVSWAAHNGITFRCGRIGLRLHTPS